MSAVSPSASELVERLLAQARDAPEPKMEGHFATNWSESLIQLERTAIQAIAACKDPVDLKRVGLTLCRARRLRWRKAPGSLLLTLSRALADNPKAWTSET